MAGGTEPKEAELVAFPERVSSEEESLLVNRAHAVESDLRLVGLQAIRGGDYTAGFETKTSGCMVYYDPTIGESGGVFVHWVSGRELAMMAVRGDTPPMWVASLGGSVLSVMTDALERILMAAGWEVDRSAVGVHETSIKVLRSLPSRPDRQLD